ncbi:hypothetical protein D922_04181 [Enterococcus faecalis 06-MB-DW-09]|nr:hypothetical protein D922_04181 [Enterococcus faecalis 06-MB-DW-09]
MLFTQQYSVDFLQQISDSQLSYCFFLEAPAGFLIKKMMKSMC